MEASLLQSFAAWVQAHPVAAVLGVFAAPTLLLIAAELRRIFRRKRAGASEPEVRVTEPAPAARSAHGRAGARGPKRLPPPSRPHSPRNPPPLGERLRRTSDALVGRLGQLLGGRRVDDELIEELEMVLFGADLGVSTTQNLLDTVRKTATGGDASEVRRILREEILAKLLRVESERRPCRSPRNPT